jgi:hypothetical protein
MAAARSRNIRVSEASRPVLPRHAKLKFDETRQVWVILAPERVLAPDEISSRPNTPPNARRSRPTSSPCCRTLPIRAFSPKPEKTS